MKPARVLASLVVLAACSDPSSEAAQFTLPITAGPQGLTGTAATDLGWQISLSEVELHLRDLQMTIQGETHTALRAPLSLFVSTAHAHPGHYAGGEVIGELAGAFDATATADSPADVPIGEATLLPGQFRGANVSYARGADGHTAHLKGAATKDARTVNFEATLDIADDAQTVGMPFDATLDADSGGHARLNLLVTDPYLGHNLFDGQDFAALDADGDDQALLAPGTPEGTRLARQFIRHDFWYLLYVSTDTVGEN
jgi:hypothetical protein